MDDLLKRVVGGQQTSRHSQTSNGFIACYPYHPSLCHPVPSTVRLMRLGQFYPPDIFVEQYRASLPVLPCPRQQEYQGGGTGSKQKVSQCLKSLYRL